MNIAKIIFRVLWGIDRFPSRHRTRWDEYWFFRNRLKEPMPCLRDPKSEQQIGLEG